MHIIWERILVSTLNTRMSQKLDSKENVLCDLYMDYQVQCETSLDLCPYFNSCTFVSYQQATLGRETTKLKVTQTSCCCPASKSGHL